ncbi:MAG: hypothetical protein ABI868_00365 [Acidobacteriota bacterium]
MHSRGRGRLMALIAAAVLWWAPHAAAQNRGDAPPAPKAAAPIDLTGYWVAIVTEDWRYRMVTPTKGDYQAVPMTAEARKVADAWDPAADEAAGNQCKSYGAAAIMRAPGRLHITWQDDRTLRLEFDAGTQTRTFPFEAPPAGLPSWQGESVAQWERPGGRGGAGRGGAADARPPKGGSLKVTTKNMRAGYLRKNGVPYSESAVLTEYFDVAPQRNGDQLLVVTAIVDDPKYLTQGFVVSSQFKKQADARGWDPTPCSSTW